MSDADPLVSVVMPFFNAAPFIAEAIDSVVAQTYDRWELLLVDDGSTDESAAIAREYERRYPDRVRGLAHESRRNRGAGAARNLGVRHARGELIAFLDADDVWIPGKLTAQVALMSREAGDAALLYGRTKLWFGWTGLPDDVSRDRVTELAFPPETMVPPLALLEQLLTDEMKSPSLSSVVVRKGVFDAVGGFEEAYRHMYEDWIFLTKVNAVHPVYVAGDCWDVYRQHDDSTCHVGTRFGEYHATQLNPARARFLRWVDRFLAGAGLRDTRAASVLRREIRPYEHPMAWLNVERVTVETPDYSRLHGFNVESPQPRVCDAPHATPLIGWVLPREQRARTVEILRGNEVLREIPVGTARPDIAAVFGERHDGAACCGFNANVNLIGAGGGTFHVRARLDNGELLPIASIRTRRRELRPVRGGSRARVTARQRPLVLMYHRVVDKSHDPWSICVTPRHFDEHMEVLRRYTNPVPLAALDVRPVRDVPHRPVAVTFDDGYADLLHGAAPILRRHDIPATVFITAGRLGARDEFWWDELESILLGAGTLPRELCLTIGGEELRFDLADSAEYTPHAAARHAGWKIWHEPRTQRQDACRQLHERLMPLAAEERGAVMSALRRAAGAVAPSRRPGNQMLTQEELVELSPQSGGTGVEVGAHTLSHPMLSTLPEGAQLDEIVGSKRGLERVLGREITSFAYPYGDYTPRTIELVRGNGFARACAASRGRVGHETDLCEIPRCGVDDCDGDVFASRLSKWIRSD